MKLGVQPSRCRCIWTDKIFVFFVLDSHREGQGHSDYSLHVTQTLQLQLGVTGGGRASTGVMVQSHVVEFTVDIWRSYSLAPRLDARGNFGEKAGLGLAGGSTVVWTVGEEEHYVTIVA